MGVASMEPARRAARRVGLSPVTIILTSFSGSKPEVTHRYAGKIIDCARKESTPMILPFKSLGF